MTEQELRSLFFAKTGRVATLSTIEYQLFLWGFEEGRRTQRSLTKEKTMDIQRLRNLTTGRLHTKIGHVYEDLEIITGEKGLMTHMLPRAARAVEPWLREHVTEPRFWDGEYDTTHTGDYALPEPTADDRAAMFERYKAQPNPLEGKNVVAVQG